MWREKEIAREDISNTPYNIYRKTMGHLPFNYFNNLIFESGAD